VIKVKIAVISYVLFAFVSMGHWFAFEFGSDGGPVKSNVVSGVVVSIFWPSYVSYVLFKESD